MKQLYLALATVGATVLVLGLLSSALRRSVLSIPTAAMLAGVLLGPVLGVFEPQSWGLSTDTLLEETARVTLAIALMGVALRLPPGFLKQQWRSLSVQIVGGMLLMWGATTLLLYLLLDLPFLLTLLAAAVVIPTDPVVAGSIVTGELAKDNVRAELRHGISAESGANDGLAYPFVMLPILLLAGPAGGNWTHWLGKNVLLEVGGAIAFGAALGTISGLLLRGAEARRMLEQHSFLAHTVALSLLALGSAKLLGLNGILAVFVTGIAFDAIVSSSDRAEEEKVQEAFNQFFMLPIFLLFGLLLPWRQWLELGWTGLAVLGSVLLLRRLPAFLLLRRWIPLLRDRLDAAFVGWFGPIGVATLYYAVMARSRTGEEMIWTIGSLLVFGSLIAHGGTAGPLTKRFGRRHKHSSDTDSA